MKTSNGKIRILHITQPTKAGVGTYVFQILKHLDLKKFKPCLIAPLDDGGIAAQARKLEIEVVYLRFVRKISPLQDLAVLVRLVFLIRRMRPDLVHAHSTKAGVLGRLASAVLRIPCIYTPNAYAFLSAQGLKRLFYLWVERLLRPITRRLLAVSQSEKDRSIQEVRFSPRKIAVINNAVQLMDNVPVPNMKGDQTPFLLMVGRLTYQKNPEMFVRAAAEVARHFSSARFTIIGGAYHDHHGDLVKELIYSLELQERLEILEWMTQEALYKLVTQASVVVVPSRYEGMPFIVLESMALGKPVVGTRVDGIKDTVVDGETGFVVELDDVTAMADRIIQLLEDPALRTRMGQEGRRRVEEHFNISQNIKQIEKVYTEVYHQTMAR